MNFNKRIIKNLKNVPLHIVLILWGIIALFPMIWVFYSSFKTNSEIITSVYSLPSTPQWSTYSELMGFTEPGEDVGLRERYTGYNYFKYLFNSLLVTISSITVTVFICIFASYGISQYEIKGKNIILSFLIGIMAIPLFAIFIPLYFFIFNLGLLNNYFGLILPLIAFGIPFSIIIFQAYFRTFPRQIIEAAKIDGCSEWSIVFRIVLPMSKGPIATVSILNFIGVFNEYLLALIILSKNEVRTVPVSLNQFTEAFGMINYEATFAAVTLSMLPPMIVYLIFHKYIIENVGIGMDE